MHVDHAGNRKTILRRRILTPSTMRPMLVPWLILPHPPALPTSPACLPRSPAVANRRTAPGILQRLPTTWPPSATSRLSVPTAASGLLNSQPKGCRKITAYTPHLRLPETQAPPSKKRAKRPASQSASPQTSRLSCTNAQQRLASASPHTCAPASSKPNLCALRSKRRSPK